MLKVSKINFYYGEIQILFDISLEVKKGEFVVILGPNGHGKSTLMKNICGILKPSSGIIKYDNMEIQRIEVQKIVENGLVYIAEDRNLFKDMTVLENLLVGAYTRSARLKEKENLEYVYQLFPKLKILGKQKASTLSGGEARMLAIGRGIMSNPQFLAIDEPSLGLAPNLRQEVFKKIDEIRKTGKSVLVVEQNSAIVTKYADVVYVIEDGKIIFYGSINTALNDKKVRRAFLGC